MNTPRLSSAKAFHFSGHPALTLSVGGTIWAVGAIAFIIAVIAIVAALSMGAVGGS